MSRSFALLALFVALITLSNAYSLTDFFGNYYVMSITDENTYFTHIYYSIDPTTLKPHVLRYSVSAKLDQQTLAYWSQKDQKYIYEEKLTNKDSSVITYEKYKSTKLSLLPWDNCASTANFLPDTSAPFSNKKYTIPLKSNKFNKYLSENANLYTTKCNRSPNLNLETDYSFVFSNFVTDFTDPWFFTDGLTSLTINQFNKFDNEANMTKVVGAVFKPFYDTKTTTTPGFPDPPASTTSTPPYYNGAIPTGLPSFPYRWTRFYVNQTPYWNPGLLRYAIQQGSTSPYLVNQILFVDKNLGFSKYVASNPSRDTNSPVIRIFNNLMASIYGYTIVQTNQWYFGTTNALSSLPDCCCDSSNYAVTGRLYSACVTNGGGLQIVIGTGTTWDYGTTNAPANIDTWLNVPFTFFYTLTLRYYNTAAANSAGFFPLNV